MEVLNLDGLPEEGKKKIVEYYQEILKEFKEFDKNKSWKFNREELHDERFNNSILGKKLRLKEHFSKFNFKPIKFNREEANAR